LDRITQEQETNNKLAAIRAKSAQVDFDLSKNAAGRKLSGIEDDPSSSQTQKLQAQSEYLEALQITQIIFNREMDGIEKSFGAKSEGNSQVRERCTFKDRPGLE
jgi:hypothetical protein